MYTPRLRKKTRRENTKSGITERLAIMNFSKPSSLQWVTWSKTDNLYLRIQSISEHDEFLRRSVTLDIGTHTFSFISAFIILVVVGSSLFIPRDGTMRHHKQGTLFDFSLSDFVSLMIYIPWASQIYLILSVTLVFGMWNL